MNRFYDPEGEYPSIYRPADVMTEMLDLPSCAASRFPHYPNAGGRMPKDYLGIAWCLWLLSLLCWLLRIPYYFRTSWWDDYLLDILPPGVDVARWTGNSLHGAGYCDWGTWDTENSDRLLRWDWNCRYRTSRSDRRRSC